MSEREKVLEEVLRKLDLAARAVYENDDAFTSGVGQGKVDRDETLRAALEASRNVLSAVSHCEARVPFSEGDACGNPMPCEVHADE